MLAPLSVTVPAIGADPTIAVVIRHALAASVADLLREEPDALDGEDVEAVHRYRVATRRLRSDLRTFRRFLDPDRVEALRDGLRWLGAAVGAVRDRDVLAERFERGTVALAEIDREAAAALLARIGAQRDEARGRLHALARDEGYIELRAALARAAGEPPWRGSDPPTGAAAPVVRRMVRSRWRPVRDAVSGLPEAPDGPTDADLHRVRILTKRARYAAEAATPAVGRPAKRFAKRLAAVQDVLGGHQDTVVAEAWLREAAAAEPGIALVAGQLIARERAQRAACRSEWPAAWRAAARRDARAWFA